METIKVGIIGARSLSSGLLIKFLLKHENVKITMLISENAGEDIQKEHTFLRNLIDKKTEKYDKEKIIENCDLVFLHKQKGEAIINTSDIIELSQKKGKETIRVIDLSANFRLKNASQYQEWYRFKHEKPELIDKFVYGLTEINRKEIKKAKFIANPGCYPTAILLGLAPLFKSNFVDNSQTIIIDAYSGVSGAGKNGNGNNLALAYNVEQNIIPYKIGREHQHVPEIEQELNKISGKENHIVFSPHVVAFKYGILATSYIKLKEFFEWEKIHLAYKEMYKDEPFIRILNKEEFPQVKDVEGTNFCDISFTIDNTTKLCMVQSTIDNVIKGASGQAIQNMNVMYGFEETTGLP